MLWAPTVCQELWVYYHELHNSVRKIYQLEKLRDKWWRNLPRVSPLRGAGDITWRYSLLHCYCITHNGATGQGRRKSVRGERSGKEDTKLLIQDINIYLDNSTGSTIRTHKTWQDFVGYKITWKKKSMVFLYMSHIPLEILVRIRYYSQNQQVSSYEHIWKYNLSGKKRKLKIINEDHLWRHSPCSWWGNLILKGY